MRNTAVTKAKQWRERLDDREVRNARRFVRQAERSPGDVVVFGDSSWIFVAPGDEDRRPLGPTVDDGLGPDVELRQYLGAGYHPGLFEAFLHLESMLAPGPRPVFLFPLTVRMHTLAWRYHPFYEYRRAIDKVMATTSLGEARRLRMSTSPPDAAALARYGATTITTWTGTRTVDEFRRGIKDPASLGLSSDEREKLLYEFHYGETLDPTSEAMAIAKRFGKKLRDSGVTAVFYETPIPIERGSEHFGPMFAEHAAANAEMVRAAIASGYGEELDVVRTGLIMGTHEFLDPADGSEHLNEHGRQRLAGMLCERLLTRVGESVASG